MMEVDAFAPGAGHRETAGRIGVPMQRLVLVVVLAAAFVAAVLWLGRFAAGLARSGAPATPGSAQGSGAVPKLAYAALFVLIAGTSAGWLEGL